MHVLIFLMGCLLSFNALAAKPTFESTMGQKAFTKALAKMKAAPTVGAYLESLKTTVKPQSLNSLRMNAGDALSLKMRVDLKNATTFQMTISGHTVVVRFMELNHKWYPVMEINSQEISMDSDNLQDLYKKIEAALPRDHADNWSPFEYAFAGDSWYSGIGASLSGLMASHNDLARCEGMEYVNFVCEKEKAPTADPLMATNGCAASNFKACLNDMIANLATSGSSDPIGCDAQVAMKMCAKQKLTGYDHLSDATARYLELPPLNKSRASSAVRVNQ